MKKLLVVTGSVRSGRAVDNVLKLVLGELKNYKDIETTVADLKDLPMPFFDDANSPNSEAFAPTNEAVIKWTELVKSTDAVLFITPEYNASISGVLKNAIDWVGGPWAEKQVAIVGYGWSASNSGRKHLTDIMTRLKSNVLEPQTGLSFMKEISVDGTAQDENAAEMVKNTLNAVFKPIDA